MKVSREPGLLDMFGGTVEIHVDGIGDIVIQKGEPPSPRDWVALAIAKLDERVSALEQSERIRKEVEHGQ